MKNLSFMVLGILVLAGLVWIARPASPVLQQGESDGQSSNVSTAVSNSSLAIEEASNYDFGSISMAAGKVSYTFKIKSTSSEPVIISKMYTSCMCTVATLVVGNKQFGPVGMPGHGTIPKINQSIGAGEEAAVKVVFDPAAHGPAGVGRVERSVILENNMGKPIELLIAATVTP